MSIFIGIIVLLACFRMQYSGKNEFFKDYLAKDNIQPIKGIFILLVFASHFSQYVSYTSPLSKPYLLLRQDLGQLIVVPFLFYSGYGVAVSVQKKGIQYIRSMPIKRFLGVLFQFDIAVLLFWVVQILRGNIVGVKHFLLSLVAWDSLGNSNWYIFAILALYLISYFTCFGLSTESELKKQKEAGWLIFILSLCLIWILKRHRPAYCYNTILVYATGFLYAQYRESIERLCFQSERAYWLIYGVILLLFYIYRKSWAASLAAYEAASIMFGLIIVLATAKFRINNRILRYCGEHLFSLYILQRLPMAVLSWTPIKTNITIYFLCSLALSLLLSWGFDLVIPKIWKRIEGVLQQSI